MLIVYMYVDDLIFIGDFGIKNFKKFIKIKFEMNDLRLTMIFLGIEVQQSEIVIFISHSKLEEALCI